VEAACWTTAGRGGKLGWSNDYRFSGATVICRVVAGAQILRDTIVAAGRGPEPIPWPEILDVSRFVLELDAESRGADG